jgi:hypothetical protein
MKVPAYIRNVAIPLGAPLHKDGSSMSSIIKIAAHFSMFGKEFTDPMTLLTALGKYSNCSVVEEGFQMGYIEKFWLLLFMVFHDKLPAAMIDLW